MKSKKYPTEDEKTEMLRRYMAGEDGRKISLEFGLGKSYVYGLALARNVKVGGRGRTGGIRRGSSRGSESYEFGMTRRVIPWTPPKMAPGIAYSQLVAGR